GGSTGPKKPTISMARPSAAVAKDHQRSPAMSRCWSHRGKETAAVMNSTATSTTNRVLMSSPIAPSPLGQYGRIVRATHALTHLARQFVFERHFAQALDATDGGAAGRHELAGDHAARGDDHAPF